jgi:hypothetical protein
VSDTCFVSDTATGAPSAMVASSGRRIVIWISWVSAVRPAAWLRLTSKK